MKVKQVIMIAHGGKSIGMGHVIRSLSLATQFHKQGFHVQFISKYELGQKIIIDQGFSVLPMTEAEIESDNFYFGEKETLSLEIKKMIPLIYRIHPDVIVVDSYHVSAEFLRELTKYTDYLAYIDDIDAFCYPVSMVINGNISADTLSYSGYHQGQKLLLGLAYNQIRHEFSNINQRIVKKRVHNILITTGAADPKNMTGTILKYLCQESNFDSYQIRVVLGSAFLTQHKESLQKTYHDLKNIDFYDSPKDMSQLMQWAEIGICAGGSTIYEFFACGVVALAFIYSENQRSIVTKAYKEGLLFSLGEDITLSESLFHETFQTATQDFILRKQMVAKMQSAVDGKGTKRIVDVIKEELECQSFEITDR